LTISISEIRDGIYRIAGFVGEYGITFNQFLINDIKPTLIHTGPLGMYSKIEEKVKEVVPIEKLSYIAYILRLMSAEEWSFSKYLRQK